MWQNISNAILALWVIVGAYLYVPSGAGRVVMIITGVVMAILGFWGGTSTSEEGGRHSMQH